MGINLPLVVDGMVLKHNVSFKLRHGGKFALIVSFFSYKSVWWPFFFTVTLLVQNIA